MNFLANAAYSWDGVEIEFEGEISTDEFSFETASDRGATIVDTEKADGRVW